MTSDRDDSKVDNVFQNRGETSAIVIALIIGVFSILVLYREVPRFSLAWFALSIVYWSIFAVGIQLILSWMIQILLANHLLRKNHADLEKEVEKIVIKNKLLEKVYWAMLRDTDDKRMSRNVYFYVGISIFSAILLWVTIAIEPFCIDRFITAPNEVLCYIDTYGNRGH